MDSDIYQLERSDCKTPKLLLQYSYYLNKTCTNQIITGYDTFSFRAYAVFISHISKNFIFVSADNWKFITQCLPSANAYVNKLTDEFQLRQSDDAVLKVEQVNNEFNSQENYICLSDNIYNAKIYLGIEDLDVLIKLSYYLSLMVNHLNSCWAYVREFYRSYLIKCFTNNIGLFGRNSIF